MACSAVFGWLRAALGSYVVIRIVDVKVIDVDKKAVMSSRWGWSVYFVG